MLRVFLSFFNRIWALGKLPGDWKHAIVIPILKEGKDGTVPSSYRPISLISVVCKLREKMVNNRLVFFLEKNNLLYKGQSGFRKGRSVMDHISALANDARKSRGNQESLLGVFLDIQKAYDSVWKNGLLYKLSNLGVNGRMYDWIGDFLSDRTFQVRVGLSLSSSFHSDNGIPQGSCLSPTLFSIMINDVASIRKLHSKLFLFADDIAMWIQCKNLAISSKKLQDDIRRMEKWAEDWGFKLSADKSEFIRFSRKKKTDDIAMVINGTCIHPSRVVSFLGVTFDKGLTWTPQVKELIGKCAKGINLLRCLSGTEWGAHRDSLLMIYKAKIRSHLDYGCLAFGDMAKSNRKKLETVQSKALRVCLGAFTSTPVSALLVEIGEMPLSLRWELLRMKYWARSLSSGDNHPGKSLFENCWEYLKLDNNSASLPLGLACIKLAKEMKLDSLPVSPQNKVPIGPPWTLEPLRLRMDLWGKMDSVNPVVKRNQVIEFINASWSQSLQIYADGSKEPSRGRTAAAICICPCGQGLSVNRSSFSFLDRTICNRPSYGMDN